MKGKNSVGLPLSDAPSISLSSFFIKKSSKATGLDAELDNIFKSSVRIVCLLKWLEPG
jgi:hypothetical protein